MPARQGTMRRKALEHRIPKREVSERAVFARVKRTLARNDIYLHKCRSNAHGYTEVGDYYTTDARSYFQDKMINLESLARSLGVLRPYEVIAQD